MQGWEPDTDAGLSPRVRGNHGLTMQGWEPDRSIPACAGEPHLALVVAGSHRVYPRVCGGTRPYLDDNELGMGLSPRVRGNRSARADHKALSRSIPACAGEPRETGHLTLLGRVYPRVCGGTRAASRRM